MRVLLFASLLMVLTPLPSFSQSVFVQDQTNMTDDVIRHGPVPSASGQAFVPTHRVLHVIQLLLEAGEGNLDVSLTLHAQDLAQPVLPGGRSTTVHLPAQSGRQLVEFYFFPGVELVPGVTYLAQLTPQSQSPFYYYLTRQASYRQGTLWEQGSPIESADLWFQTGRIP